MYALEENLPERKVGDYFWPKICFGGTVVAAAVVAQHGNEKAG